MKTSDIGLQLITHMEGVKLRPYLDKCGIATVGVGHAIADDNGEWIRDISKVPPHYFHLEKEDINEMLENDVIRFENNLNSLPLSFEQYQFDALMSFTFNLGFGALQTSTLLKSMKGLDGTPIEDCFMMFDKIRVDGKLIPDNWQIARRKTESFLYLTGELKFYA